MRRVTAVLFLLSMNIIACGGSSAPPAESPPAASEEPAKPSDSQNAEAKPSIESQREPFLQACMSRTNSREYCECGFEQFKEVFKDADLSQTPAQDDPRLRTLAQKTVSACASKLSEDQVKTNFTEGCVGGDERKRAYCTCAWPALRKHLEVVDFIGSDAESPRFLAAKKQMVVACKGKFPSEVAEADFMKGCGKEDPSRDARCKCLWKKLKAKFTAEELAAGTADVTSVKDLAECK